MTSNDPKQLLAWLEQQKKAVQLYLDQGLFDEAAVQAEYVLNDLAPLEGAFAGNRIFADGKAFFHGVLGKAGMAPHDDALPPEVVVGRTDVSPDEHFTRGEALLDLGETEPALEEFKLAFEGGLKNYTTVSNILDCLKKLGHKKAQMEFLQNRLSEMEWSTKEQAELMFYLGTLQLAFGERAGAERSFLGVRDVDPDFPGLAEKMTRIRRSKESERPKSRYGLLIEHGQLTEEEERKIIKEAKEKGLDADELMCKHHGMTREIVGAAVADFYGTRFQPYDPMLKPPFEIFNKRKMDFQQLRESRWLPLGQFEDEVDIVIADPTDEKKLEEIRFVFPELTIKPLFSFPDDIEQLVDYFAQRVEENIKRAIAAGEKKLEESQLDEDFTIDEQAMAKGDQEVVKVVDSILVQAYKMNASDIHIEPNLRNQYCLVRLRVDGSCFEYKRLPFLVAKPMVSRLKILAFLDIAERRLPQDGKIKIKLPSGGQVVEYRVATLPTVDAQEDVVLRVLASGKPLPLERLGLLPKCLETFQKSLYVPYGLVLVVGPTGSGKTTTLHSGLSYINTPDRKIWTAEDPVEITQEGLRQLQVKPSIGLTFAAAMRSFLRADPDVIMIGEMRDRETSHIGIEASLTGHLVFSTLHTNSAPETITRLLDMDVDPFNFSDSLICVLAQRLMKTLCGRCKERYRPSLEEIDSMSREFGANFGEKVKEYTGMDPYRATLFRPKGCSACNNGYKGRIGVHELMVNSPALKSMIKFKTPTEELREEAMNGGMLTLKQDGMMKVFLGHTDMKQVRAVSAN